MFIARQPIFNQSKRVVAYELLFRQEREQNCFTGTNPHAATAFVVGGLFENGLYPIVGEKTAYINADYDFLMSESLELLEPKNLMIEITEDVIPDKELMLRLTDLKNKGYSFALDDYEEGIAEPLLGYAAVVKFDIRATPMENIDLEKITLINNHTLFLAEKVETGEEFIKAKEMGFKYFQGFFFRRPRIVEGIRGKNEKSAVYTRIFQELRKEEPSFERLETLIGRDPKMTYTLIRISSKAYNQKKQFTLKRALTNMGLRQLQRWIYILMLQDASQGKPRELMRLALVRTRLGEEIARNSILKKRRDEVALMCILSVIDAMLDEPMEKVLEDLQISQEIKDALVLQKGSLAAVMELIEAYESGRWKDVDSLQQQLNIHGKDLSHSYLEAIRWAEEVMMEF